MARTSQIRQQQREQGQEQSAESSADTSGPSTDISPSRLEYPGLGLPLRFNNEDGRFFYPHGAHANCRNSTSDLVAVREVAMMNIMEKLTDKVDWHKKVFDDEIVAKWRQEALAVPNNVYWRMATGAKIQQWPDDNNGAIDFPENYQRWLPELEGIMNTTSFDSCVEELRSKAKYFEKSGIVPTLDANASVAKSDNAVSPELHEALRNSFDQLKADHAASPDWHPNSNDQVQDLVHPSMYPLVYGRSRVFQKECVGVLDAVNRWAGMGEVIAKIENNAPVPYNGWYEGIPPNFWSDTYQWLPANVSFQQDGSVRFTSYINNLHPTKYPEIYRTIEKLIETSLPLWDQCLALSTSDRSECKGSGRRAPRLGPPEDPDDETPENWVPSDPAECADAEVTEEQLEDKGYEEGENLAEYKWKIVRKPKIPEVPFTDVDYAPKEGQRLIDHYRKSGLQVIVKMASIELTPEKPDFPVGGWHVEGQMNEHICATALYYLDSENITETNLSFRMQTDYELEQNDNFMVGQDCYHWLEQIYGTSLSVGSMPCLQNYGSVETREGRLLAFPNVFQHRVSPFKLVDPTKSGHRRFIALWLVDPNLRVISTANVPPQQMTWYAESLLGSSASTRSEALSKLPPELIALLADQGLSKVAPSEDGKLPAELMEMVKTYFEEGKAAMPMSVDEAREHRAKLMAERGAFVQDTEKGWQSYTYSFCEH